LRCAGGRAAQHHEPGQAIETPHLSNSAHKRFSISPSFKTIFTGISLTFGIELTPQM